MNPPIPEEPKKSSEAPVKKYEKQPKKLPVKTELQALSGRTKTRQVFAENKTNTKLQAHESLQGLDMMRDQIEKRFIDLVLSNEKYKKIVQTPDSTPEVQSYKRFIEMSASDLLLLRSEGFPLMECIKIKGGTNELKYFFGKNESLRQGNLPVEALVPPEILRVKYQGEEYARKPNGGFQDADGESLVLWWMETVTLMVLSKGVKPLTEQEKKDADAYRENLLKDARFRDNSRQILEAYKKGEEPKLAPKTDNPKDAEVFITFLLAFFWKIFGKDLKVEDVKDSLDPAKQPEVVQKAMKQRAESYQKGTIPFGIIRSRWVEYSEKGTPKCSATVQTDASNIFWLTLPSGDASAVQKAYDTPKWRWVGYVNHIDTQGNSTENILKSFQEEKWANVVDLFTHSNKKYKGMYYGHRALGFRNEADGQWYVLDAYTSQKNTAPIPMKEYLERVCGGYHRPMERVVFYKSEKRVG